MGISLNGVLPTYFELIDDESLYTPNELGDLIGVSPETIRNYCRTSKINYQGIGHYKILGIDMKRFLFCKLFKRIPKQTRELVINT
ncbi:helix-turn-helix domain-containing protein [Bacillus sp. CMF21]|nr:helix-turn-helix domain-containing protein [Bacillus sp. CMF21]